MNWPKNLLHQLKNNKIMIKLARVQVLFSVTERKMISIIAGLGSNVEPGSENIECMNLVTLLYLNLTNENQNKLDNCVIVRIKKI